MVTHPSTNLARRVLTSFRQRTLLTSMLCRQPCDYVRVNFLFWTDFVALRILCIWFDLIVYLMLSFLFCILLCTTKSKKKLKTWISVVLHLANAKRAHLHRCYVLCSDSFDQRCGVGILRWREGLNRSPAKLTVVGGMHHTYLSFSTISLCLLHCSVPIQVLLCSMNSYCSYNLLLHMGAVLTGSTIETTIFLAVIQASLC